MSKSITNAILENVKNRRLVEMPEDGDSPMGLLGQVLDTMTGLGWGYSEINYSNDEVGYEFENWSPAGEDLILDACCGKKDLSDDEKGKNLIEDIVNYCDNFDVDEHVEMWLSARDSVRGVPQSARALVDDADGINDMYQEIVKALRSLNHPMNESYVYNWKDDIEDVEATEENDDIWYAVAENMCETGNSDGYGSDPYEVMSNIINLFKISKRSRLYKYLLKWYGSEEKLQSEVRDIYETNDAIYFTTGCGYAIFDADLLGGNADGNTEREFNKFVEKEEGLTEGKKEDPKWYCIDCGKKKEDYESMYCDDCWEKEQAKAGGKIDANVMSFKEWKGSEDYWGRLSDNFGVDSETDLETHNVSTQDIWDLYKEYQVAVMSGGKVYTKADYMDEGKKYSDDELFNMLIKSDKFIDKVKKETGIKDLTSDSGEVKDRAEEWLSGNHDGVISLLGLKESTKILTEAPGDPEEEEEYELVDDGVPEELPAEEETPVEEPAEEEMTDTEYEEEAEDDAKDTVSDDIEEPFYATTPEFDELRDILVDLDYRLFLINDDMVCIGRLNGPDIEFLTSNTPNVKDDANVSDANDKAEEVEERAEEDEEDSFEYLWIKAPDTFDKFVNQVNVVYLSPDMSEEDKEQYAGIEASHESVMNFLMNELPEELKKEHEKADEEEAIEDIPAEAPTDIEEPPVEEVPAEEEPIVGEEENEEEEEEK